MITIYPSDFPNNDEMSSGSFLENKRDYSFDDRFFDSFNHEENLSHLSINYQNNESEDKYNDFFNQYDFLKNEEEREQMTLEEIINKSTKTNSETNPVSKEPESCKKQKKHKKQSKIFIITKEMKPKTKETPKFLGKKHQSENHSKFAFDNLVRKIKSKLFGSILIILNKSLESNNKEKTMTLNEPQRVKKGEVSYECFLKPDQKIILQTNVRENLTLLDSKLRDIFSENVSTKAKNFSKEYQLGYNKNFIEKIKNDEKKKKTNDILDMTFFQCLEHFRGTNKYEALNGLEKEYEKVIEELSDDEEYLKSFKWQLNHFEDLYKNKRARNRNSNKKKISADEQIFYMQI
jgi:hypothetical protein